MRTEGRSERGLYPLRIGPGAFNTRTILIVSYSDSYVEGGTEEVLGN
jgi:hypothetical protein